MRLDVQEGLREQGNHKIILLLIVPTPLLCFKTRGLCRGCKFGASVCERRLFYGLRLRVCFVVSGVGLLACAEDGRAAIRLRPPANP